MTHQSPSGDGDSSSQWPSLRDTDWASVAAVVYGVPTLADIARVQQLKTTPDGVRLMAEVDAEARAGGVHVLSGNLELLRRRAEGIVRGEQSLVMSLGRSPHALPLGKPSLPEKAVFRMNTLMNRYPSRFGRNLSLVAAFGVLLAIAVVTKPAVWSREKEATVYTTAAGEQSHLHLPDGSQITLAPQSRLVVPSTFGESGRHITLTGEAYFDVVSTIRSPFVVHTGDVSTRVLGTMFDVRHYDTDTDIRVVVLRGKVTTSLRTSTVLLSAGMVGRITDSGIVRATTSAVDLPEWTNGRLIFHKASLPMVLAEVERWTGYEFRFADSSQAAVHVTTALPVRDSRETMVLLKDLLDVTMTFEGHVVTLHPRRPSNRPHEPTRMQDSLVFHSEVGK